MSDFLVSNCPHLEAQKQPQSQALFRLVTEAMRRSYIDGKPAHLHESPDSIAGEPPTIRYHSVFDVLNYSVHEKLLSERPLIEGIWPPQITNHPSSWAGKHLLFHNVPHSDLRTFESAVHYLGRSMRVSYVVQGGYISLCF